MSIFVRARFDVLEGRRADFERLVRALSEQAADEPGTLTYRFFSAEDGGYLVLEQYTDEDAARTHNEGAAELLGRVAQCATPAYAEIYGPLGPWLRAWVEANPQATAFADFPTPSADA